MSSPNKKMTHIVSVPSHVNKGNKFCKYLPVHTQKHVVLALVDSGNGIGNAISAALAKFLKIKAKRRYTGPMVGTAKKGQTLNIIGIIPKFHFKLTDSSQQQHSFTSPLLIVKHLSCGLNFSGPWLRASQINQLHTLDCLEHKGIKFPLYESLSHARMRIKHPSVSRIVISTIGDENCKVYSAPRKTVISPFTAFYLPVCLNQEVITPQDGTPIFSIHSRFFDKIKEQLDNPNSISQLITMNEQDQIVTPFKGKHFQILFFNNTEDTITISNNSLIGSLNLVEKVKMLPMKRIEIQTAKTKEAAFMSNAPSRKLSSADKERRRKYIKDIIRATQNSSFQKNPTILKELLELLSDNWNSFYREGNPGGTSLIEHPVYTPKSANPIKIKNRPINPGLIPDLKEQIATWLKEGVIKSGNVSPWNFPLLPVRKKNGKWRWVVDFRQLNNITRKDSFPIPNIVELLSYLSGSKYFTSLDLAAAFHSIPIRQVDQEKLSFSALDQSYRFVRMPFGLTSAPNTWARLVINVLQHIPKTKLIVFFDDLLIHSPTMTDHLSTLKSVLTAISQAGLRINLEKSDWIKTQVKFLGHIISKDGVSVPNEFSTIIKDWPLPLTLKQLRSFMGKCNYYRSHFKDFGKIAAPLMEHLKGTTEGSRKLNLITDPQAIESFNKLKELLVSPQLLAYPNFSSKEPFILDTDYSNNGIGVVLSQLQKGKGETYSF